MLFEFFFFFKQKTAYELRISDWSSDVCSSDLHGADLRSAAVDDDRIDADLLQQHDIAREPGRQRLVAHGVAAVLDDEGLAAVAAPIGQRLGQDACLGEPRVPPMVRDIVRSEEHMSELQSLMRNSYAVFCLKKKTILNSYTDRPQISTSNIL